MSIGQMNDAVKDSLRMNDLELLDSLLKLEDASVNSTVRKRKMSLLSLATTPGKTCIANYTTIN